MRTVKGDLKEFLNAANQLQPNLQFTLEKASENGILDFLDNNVNVDTLENLSVDSIKNQLIQGQFLILGAALHSIMRRTK